MQPERSFYMEPEFEKALKAGVYAALHAEGVLTEEQLAQLLERLETRGETLCFT